jgi:hypothetical protein
VPTPFKNGTYRLHVGRGDGYGQVILTVGPDKASLRALQHPRMLEVDEVPHRLVPLQTVWAVIHYSLPDQYQDQRAAFKLQMAKAGCKPWKPLPGIYAYKGFPRSIPPPTTNYSGRGSDQWYFYHYTGTIAVLRRLTKSFERYAAVTNNRRKPSMTITVSTVDGTVIDSRPTSWDLDQPRRD